MFHKFDLRTLHLAIMRAGVGLLFLACIVVLGSACEVRGARAAPWERGCDPLRPATRLWPGRLRVLLERVLVSFRSCTLQFARLITGDALRAAR